MFDEFIVVAQPARIEYFVVVHHNGIVQTAAHGQAVGAHHLHIFGEAEGAGTGNIFGVIAGTQVEFHALAGRVHGGVVEINFETQFVAVVGQQPRPLGLRARPLAYLNKGFDPHKAAGCVLHDDSGVLQQKDKGGRRAVQYRHFFCRNVHIHIVDPEARAGRHQVLHRVDFGTARRQGRSQAGFGYRLGRDTDLGCIGEVDPAKDDAAVRCCRTQGQFHPLAAV